MPPADRKVREPQTRNELCCVQLQALNDGIAVSGDRSEGIAAWPSRRTRGAAFNEGLSLTIAKVVATLLGGNIALFERGVRAFGLLESE